MADDNKPSWSMLMWFGMFAGVALGAVLVLLFRERRGSQQQLAAPGQPINIWNMGPGAQAPQGLPAGPYAIPPAAAAQSSELSMDTRLRTVKLSPTQVNRIWHASGRNPWSVNCRCDGPPGTFIYISTERSSLNPGFTAHSNVVAIPAGQSNTIRLQPGQDLYGLANVENGASAPWPRHVMVSVIASEEPYPPTYG